jgi:hypothetical protein
VPAASRFPSFSTRRKAIRLLGRLEPRMNSERLRIAKRANSPTTLEPHTASVRQPNLGEAAGEPHSAKRRLATLPRRVIPRSPRLPSADAALTAKPRHRDEADRDFFSKDACERKFLGCSTARPNSGPALKPRGIDRERLDAFTDEDMTTSTRQHFVAIGHRAAYGSRAKHMNLSQAEFAQRFGIRVDTVQIAGPSCR